MSLVNPGLGEQLIEAVGVIQAKEAAADDDTVSGRQAKSALCRYLLVIAGTLNRGDGTNALDYDDEQRTVSENYYKALTVGLASWLLKLLDGPPVREWPEVGELAGIVAELATTEDTTWGREIVTLAGEQGVTVARGQTIAGTVAFQTPGGTITTHVYEARDPDVALNGVEVYLLEALPEDGASEPTGRYAVMVDDPWWGRRIEPAEFGAAPMTRHVTMGYRLRGRILEDGEPVEGANVSLELALESVEDGRVVAWDSLEYNELVYDAQLETWVEGANVLAPIRTDAQGRWEWIVPKGHGALYQRAGDRRDESAETARRRLARYLRGVWCAYLGRKVEVVEGTEAVLDILSGRLEISGTPGVMVRVGTLDDPGQEYTIPGGGLLTITGLPEAEHSIVAYRLTPWGTWDQSYGCARAIAEVKRGETVSVSLGALEEYLNPDVICGRVYERMGVPAAGIAIVVIDVESARVIGTIATTDGEGWWEAEVPPQGLGGVPAIHDERWGSVPVLGVPYSDVVLGARVYSAAQEHYKPEAWRKPLRGHKNFQYCAGSVVVRDADSGESYGTVETAYGGWMTPETLPKFKYVADLEELLTSGAQARHYDLVVDGVVQEAGFELRGQPFDDQGAGDASFRAAGYYPEQKLLMGGKIHGNVLVGRAARVTGNLPEAARVGLEFGEHAAFVEGRALAGEARSGAADLVCPYCGGPAQRGPSGAYLRGFCRQCADAFGRGDAMDCRGYFETPTLAATGDDGQALRFVRLSDREGNIARRVGYQWRPDLYDEREDFMTQSGAGQRTNAPRWVARHVDEFGDGLGFGRFDGDLDEPWVAGHEVAYFEALPEIGRALGVTALKLRFPYGHVAPLTYTVEIDCVRMDAEIETHTVTVPAGTAGPDANDEFGDVIRVADRAKLLAEDVGSPYRDVGLYVAVSEVRLVTPESAPGCRFTIVNDTPWLASAAGTPVAAEAATPVAVQLDAEIEQGVWVRVHTDPVTGVQWCAVLRNGKLAAKHRTTGIAEWCADIVIADAGDYQTCDITGDGNLLIVLAITSDGTIDQFWTRTDGDTWDGPETI